VWDLGSKLSTQVCLNTVLTMIMKMNNLHLKSVSNI